MKGNTNTETDTNPNSLQKLNQTMLSKVRADLLQNFNRKVRLLYYAAKKTTVPDYDHR